uniref:Lipid-A-disaccharide synthase n=1 Tax=uncultured Alphaproteobacteria bacterium TaxID=91750 RepID=A0A6G8F1T9_9PROT|nr:lipid-A-disaccharide synthase [uncultured Alphaproteobacteria bacterium]
MNNNIKIYLIAGEPSGDALGARLMRAMKVKTNGKAEFYGVGGETMEAEGFHSIFNISDLAVMGLAEVIPSIPKVLRRIKETVNDILRIRPDIVITIDSWSFGSRVQKALRRKKTGIPQLHYVAPQVWAWKKKRARTMYKYVDRLLTLLPQEPKYFTPYGLETTFVGHPVIESPVANADRETFRREHNIPEGKRIISVLPGSRHNEVASLLPTFIEAGKLLAAQYDDLFFVIPTVKTVEKRVKDIIKGCGLPLLVVEGSEDRHNAMCASTAAIAASGTVALELAIADVPHIIGYKVSKMTAFLAKRLLHIQFVNLSNILLGREIIPELLQDACTPENIAQYIKRFLNQDDLYRHQMEGLKKVRQVLGLGKQTPSENACDVILEMIKKK